ncbi:MAG: ribulose-phosphate 3-epimerase [Erysipelotrichaceae bacterium]|jgi:ribulose-phosphate 3-epimerase|nr:ribulose-phosphate 3-epimerase [Erysipelotrichaceae bacterium]
MAIVAPSILSLDFNRFTQQLKEVEKEPSSWIHFDVMDGHFVPNLTFGPKILADVKKCVDLFCDVHIMVSKPAEVADWFVKAGADLITFHLEAIDDKAGLALVESLHGRDVKAGISLKPNTPVEALLPYLPVVDLVLVMSVEPGFGGQSFMENSLAKLEYLQQYKKEHQSKYLIEVDGGINATTAPLVKQAGAEVLVAGSYVFGDEVVNRIRKLQ